MEGQDDFLRHIKDKYQTNDSSKKESSSFKNVWSQRNVSSKVTPTQESLAYLKTSDRMMTPASSTDKKTPSPPRDLVHLYSLRSNLASTSRLSERSSVMRRDEPFSASQPPPSIPSVKSLASFDSAVKRIEGSACNRLFQTPSQSLNLTQETNRFNTTMDSSLRIRKLQTSGLMDKIKAMQTALLTANLGKLVEDDDEPEEDEDNSSPANKLQTAIQSPPSDTSSESQPSSQTEVQRCSQETEIQKSSQETEIVDQEDEGCSPEEDHEMDNKENSGKQETIKEVNPDESVLFIEERPSKAFSIRKKFIINSPSRNNSRTKTEPLMHQTTLDKYFLKKKKTIPSPSISETPKEHPKSANSHGHCTKSSAERPNTPSPNGDSNLLVANSPHQRKVLPTPPLKNSASKQINIERPLSVQKKSTSSKQVMESKQPESVENKHKDRVASYLSEIKTTCLESKSPVATPSAKNLRRRSKSEANIPSLSKNACNMSRVSSKESLKSAPDDSRKGKTSECHSGKGGGHDLKKLKINGKTYFLLSLLGQGGSARVYQVYDATTHKNLAVKVVDLTKADASIRAGYENEIALLQKLSKCRRVVRLIDFERVSSHDGTVKRLFLVMEKGDSDLANVLKQFIEKDDSAPHGMRLDRHLIKHYWKEMIKAVEEIHELDVVHSDLKPVNFITVAGKLKLIDFGIANAIDSDHTSVIKDNQIGTINYMAPEALQSRADLDSSSFSSSKPSSKPIIKFNCKADIWSLGCILYNLVYGRPPFSHVSSLLQKVQVICNPKYAIDFPPMDDAALIDCLKVRKTEWKWW